MTVNLNTTNSLNEITALTTMVEQVNQQLSAVGTALTTTAPETIASNQDASAYTAVQNTSQATPQWSSDNPNLLPPVDFYSRGRVATPPETGQLTDAGINNITNPLWQEQVSLALDKNGGFGDEKTGYLAYKKDGFFRFYNPALPPKVNETFAKISLLTGYKIDELKIDGESYSPKDIEKKLAWGEEFLNKLEKFFQDPSQEFTMKLGRHRYKSYKDEKTGAIVFYKYKKSRWGSFFGKLGKILKPVSIALNFIPGIGNLASFAINAASTFTNYVGQKEKIKPMEALIKEVSPK